MTKNPHIEKLNFNGTVEEWKNQLKSAVGLKPQRKSSVPTELLKNKNILQINRLRVKYNNFFRSINLLHFFYKILKVYDNFE